MEDFEERIVIYSCEESFVKVSYCVSHYFRGWFTCHQVYLTSETELMVVVVVVVVLVFGLKTSETSRCIN